MFEVYPIEMKFDTLSWGSADWRRGGSANYLAASSVGVGGIKHSKEIGIRLYSLE